MWLLRGSSSENGNASTCKVWINFRRTTTDMPISSPNLTQFAPQFSRIRRYKTAAEITDRDNMLDLPAAQRPPPLVVEFWNLDTDVLPVPPLILGGENVRNWAAIFDSSPLLGVVVSKRSNVRIWNLKVRRKRQRLCLSPLKFDVDRSPNSGK